MTVDALGALGNDVKDIRGTHAQGLPDQELWRVATTEARLLITTDKGFSEFRNRSAPRDFDRTLAPAEPPQDPPRSDARDPTVSGIRAGVGRDYGIVPGVGIACRGAVRSILLRSRLGNVPASAT